MNKISLDSIACPSKTVTRQCSSIIVQRALNWPEQKSLGSQAATKGTSFSDRKIVLLQNILPDRSKAVFSGQTGSFSVTVTNLSANQTNNTLS